MPPGAYMANAADDWDFARERRDALARPPISRRLPLVPLSVLRARLDADPSAHVLLADLHGEHHLMRAALTALGMLDEAGARVPGRGHVIQLGDLADGRHRADPDALRMGAAWCDIILCGNHEALMLASRGSDEDDVPAQCRPLLVALADRGQLIAAHALGDILLTHAGVHAASDAPHADAATVAGYLNACFADFRATRARADALWAVGRDREGTHPWGGAMWCDWRSLSAAPARGYRQVVGHTPIAYPETNATSRAVCLDTAGNCLGVGLIDARGRGWWSCAEEPPLSGRARHR